jgi:hypothetical protein
MSGFQSHSLGRCLMSLYTLFISITPVLMITACGLTTPSVYQRLKQVLARIHSFHHQKLALLTKADDDEDEEIDMLLKMLDGQIARVSERAKVIRCGLYCLMSAIAAFSFALLLGEVSTFNDRIALMALAMGAIGISLFLLAIRMALPELRNNLPPLEEEIAYLEIVKTHRLAKAYGTIHRSVQRRA